MTAPRRKDQGGREPFTDRSERVDEGAAALSEAIERARKSMSWRMRARVGERMQWWEDVNERVDTY